MESIESINVVQVAIIFNMGIMKFKIRSRAWRNRVSRMNNNLFAPCKNAKMGTQKMGNQAPPSHLDHLRNIDVKINIIRGQIG